jgi:hypothetical protein
MDPRWKATVERFLAEDGEGPTTHEDCSWSVSVNCTLKSISNLLRDAPADFETAYWGRDAMIDDTSNDVDDESSFGVEDCAAERAVVGWLDHWQAGLDATLTVYPTRKAYEAGLRKEIASTRENDPCEEDDESEAEAYNDYLADLWTCANSDPTLRGEFALPSGGLVLLGDTYADKTDRERLFALLKELEVAAVASREFVDSVGALYNRENCVSVFGVHGVIQFMDD